MISLRQYQLTAVENIRSAYRHGRRAPVFVLPTGGGKGVLFTYVSYHAAQKGNRIGILVHREHLVRQCSDMLTEWGCPHGVIAPDYPVRQELNVQIASVQSLIRRLHKWPDAFDLIVFDESHHIRAASWMKIVAAYPKARLLGCTATPERTDGKGLGEVFDEMVLGPPMQELIANGYLAQYKMFAPRERPDLRGLHRLAGDYNQGELAERMDKAVITGDAVAHYQKHLAGAPAIAFCVTVAHAYHVAEQFANAGLQSTVIEGRTDPVDRKQLLTDLGAGRLNVLTSCEVVSEGLDVPTVQGAILLRPTESISMYLQQVGRALRPKPDGSHAVILDHAGNSLLHGLPCDDRKWSLENGLVEAARDRPAARIRTCSACFAIFSVAKCGSVCPVCGHQNKTEKDVPRHVDGELTEASPEFINKMRELELQARARGELQKLEQVRMMKGYRRGWSEHVLRGRLRKKAMKELAR